jgi:hypothetical protein
MRSSENVMTLGREVEGLSTLLIVGIFVVEDSSWLGDNVNDESTE